MHGKESHRRHTRSYLLFHTSGRRHAQHLSFTLTKTPKNFSLHSDFFLPRLLGVSHQSSHLHQDLSAGQHAVLVWERLTQLVEGGRALPEYKQVWPVSTSRILKKPTRLTVCKCCMGVSAEVYYFQKQLHTPEEHSLLLRAPADCSPGLLEAVDGVGLQRRQDGPQRGEVLQLSAFLHEKKGKINISMWRI